ncbi:hypothetical protein LWM68_29235 [Niabella sp. W65]|nr:hypothetical protein [Niabella sp. W65]MCH7366495.1 hypothetical protein [Niabella sp. W65]
MKTKPEVTNLITTVGQSSDGMGASQATAYKSEISVRLVEKKTGRMMPMYMRLKQKESSKKYW